MTDGVFETTLRELAFVAGSVPDLLQERVPRRVDRLMKDASASAAIAVLLEVRTIPRHGVQFILIGV